MDLATGQALAGELSDLLKDSVTRVEVAGGVRREKPFPHDIELVAIPRYEQEFVNGLFGPSPSGTTNVLDSTLHELLYRGVIAQGRPNKAGRRSPFSEKLYRFRFGGEDVDLFAVTKPAEWGPIFTVRTGDAAFTQHLVSYAHPRGIRFVEGRIFQHLDNLGAPVPLGKAHDEEGCRLIHLPAPEESDVFRLVGLEYLEPRKRMSATAEQEYMVGAW